MRRDGVDVLAGTLAKAARLTMVDTPDRPGHGAGLPAEPQRPSGGVPRAGRRGRAAQSLTASLSYEYLTLLIRPICNSRGCRPPSTLSRLLNEQQGVRRLHVGGCRSRPGH
jgi:hypothetical protein